MRIDRSLLAAIGCVATEINRYAINGLYLENGPQGQYAAATNGRCLIVVQGKEPEKDEDRDEIAVILEPEIVKDALKIMGKRKAAPRDAAIAIEGNKVELTLDEYSPHISDPAEARECGTPPWSTKKVAGRLVEGNYPRIRDVLPTPGKGVTVNLSIPLMLQFLNTVANITRDNSSDDITSFELTVEDNQGAATLRATLEDGRAVIGVIMPVTTKQSKAGGHHSKFESAFKSGRKLNAPEPEVVADAAD